ncbi:enoyl-CoA hydratase [Tamaricihabitans halophyticus]|uniref:Enoyl-CoA hydratase n=1 Tax=Tamaricihabitans halophyticus TaxID=1262583 RepID=A0A4R2QWL2_9PSEU|nr:enoyl-CoA hydratase/isomerase family protein [Tamaricihabitans halophyticus]TCP53664.1 enoyl-CoA hydratase [Tamaricihabitans halophyticus]
MDSYGNYEVLKLDWAGAGVLRVSIDNPSRANALDATGHGEITRIWREADADERVRAVLITGAGDNFSAGGDLGWVRDLADDPQARIAGLREARELVTNLVNFTKPVVSAVRGVAVGAGLAAALLADVSVVAKDARLIDGHTKLGVAAGDHAALIWPLLCGLAKAKYYLLTCDQLDGAEAERIGLVSLAVPDDEVTDRATEIAGRLANGAPTAVQWTKHALNSWLRSAMPHFDAALALEFLGFAGPEVQEGLAALTDKRAPTFHQDSDDGNPQGYRG